MDAALAFSLTRVRRIYRTRFVFALIHLSAFAAAMASLAGDLP